MSRLLVVVSVIVSFNIMQCKILGPPRSESCQSTNYPCVPDKNCCSGTCANGKCVNLCRKVNASCKRPSDICCSGLRCEYPDQKCCRKVGQYAQALSECCNKQWKSNSYFGGRCCSKMWQSCELDSDCCDANRKCPTNVPFGNRCT